MRLRVNQPEHDVAVVASPAPDDDDLSKRSTPDSRAATPQRGEDPKRLTCDVEEAPGAATRRELELLARIANEHRADEDEPSMSSLGELFASAPESLPADSEGGEPWGPLRVFERVGGGSFGQIYRAWYPELACEVALKRLRFAPDRQTSRASAVIREAQLLAKLDHPNVIKVHGAAKVGGEVGIWMDFLCGRTLQQIVDDNGPLSAEEARHIGECMSHALSAVHAKDILHRDVKPSNVMRAAGGRYVLLDFGTGSEVSMPAPEGVRRLIGTPLYMAPELFDGKPASKASDIYSLGVMLFFLVTGSYPVVGSSLEQIRAAHAAGRRVLLSDINPQLPTW